MNKLIRLCILVAVFNIPALHAAETPETLLIRQSLGNDKFGHRRGDVDLALSTYAENFVAYEGHNSADPRSWSVLHEDRAGFAQALATDLKTNRYDMERAVPFVLVLEKKAIATTLDSGQVVDLQSSAARPLKVQRLWTFSKTEEKWLATAFVQNIEDSLAGPLRPSVEAPEVAKLLQREEEGWEAGDVGSIVGLFDEEFIGYDGIDKSASSSWKILFSNALELENWLEKRLQSTSYTINREVVYTAIGKNRREALALTLDKISTSYASGPAIHDRTRYVLWTLSRRSGSWKITNMLYNLGLPD